MTTPLQAQTSIIDSIQKSQTSLVSIKAETADVFKNPKASAAIDSKTGRLLVLRNAQAVAYNRFGAGVIIDPSGFIVTNAHTVLKANRITVIFSDDTQTQANVVKIINDLDLAFLKVNSPSLLKAIELADSNQAQLGDEVITVGNSEFLKQTISGGKIIGLGTNRALKKNGTIRTDLIQTDINLYKGDSGGPLLDIHGRLIGLMTAGETTEDHSSFAIPSNKIKTYFLNDAKFNNK